MRHRGFSLIELMIAMLILVMLATAVTLSLEQLQSHSRDATRKESLQAYQIGFEQFRVASGHYLLDRRIDKNAIPGSNNSGIGRLTRHSIDGSTSIGLNSDYTSTDSIADVLQAAGYIAKIQTDPRLQGGIPADQDVFIQAGFTGDYFIITCNYDGSLANNVKYPNDSKQYSLFATLETIDPKHTIKAPCGSKKPSTPTPLTGNLIDQLDTSIPAAVGTDFNYVIGLN